MDNQGKSVSEAIIERYNRIHPQIRKRSDMRDVSNMLEKAMEDFGAAIEAAENALSRAEAAALR